jgi:hypothetical protein
MRLYCSPCDVVLPDYAALRRKGVELCPECGSEMREFVEPVVNFAGATTRNAVHGGSFLASYAVESGPSYSREGFLRRRQA